MGTYIFFPPEKKVTFYYKESSFLVQITAPNITYMQVTSNNNKSEGEKESLYSFSVSIYLAAFFLPGKVIFGEDIEKDNFSPPQVPNAPFLY